MDIFESLNSHYSAYDEDGRLLSRHGQVEFLTTVRYVEKHLVPCAKILEIGAGTGRYSHYFAQQGYTVDAVELVPHNIDIFKASTQPQETVTIRQGNACDLSFISSDSYEITLLLGPMYHLFTEADKLAALSEAIRVTKPDGVVFVAYCNADASIIGYGFIKGNVKSIIDTGMLDPVSFKTHSEPKDVFELYRKTDIDALMSHFDVNRLHYIGTDMATNFMRDTVDTMDDETFEIYLRYHFSICERPDLVGATHHSLDVFRKK